MGQGVLSKKAGEGQGLTTREAASRLLRDGKNELQKRKGRNIFLVFWDQLCDPLIYVLLAAAVISLWLREYSDACIIVVVVLLNACVGVAQEGKAKKALEALEHLQSPVAKVIRDGVRKELPAAELVAGDLVCLEAGDRVPADILLREAIELRTEEAVLTGESVPVPKKAGSSVYMSTTVTSGRGNGIVTATGMRTELGKIADMIHGEKEELTPLQKRLGELGCVLSVLSILLCGALFGLAVLQKRDIMEMLITAISLAVAAVPEGLPAVVTICLALSVTRMVRAKTIVRRLPSVETLGAVSVVCSDKTGTLTQGKMTVEKGFWNGRIWEMREREAAPPIALLQGAVLCNDAVLGKKDHSSKGMGDPTETALLEWAQRLGADQEKMKKSFPRVGEIPFTSERKEMITRHQTKRGSIMTYCKGAPDVILQKCTEICVGNQEKRMEDREKKCIQQAINALSEEAYRILAVGMQSDDGWVFLGLLAMRDPVRPKAADAVEVLRKAGVRTVMITGDHAKTAIAIAKKLGIAGREEQCITGEELKRLHEKDLLNEIRQKDLRIFARVSPAQKVQIVKAFQDTGAIVAMTGDGVNDAPSLRAADVGIAMGKNGTDVARQAADLVLTDDNFSTIERAIEEGRGVYENIRKSVLFLLSSNLGELLTMFISVLLGFAAPLKSAHILWINLITDSLPALALGVDQNDGRELMRHSPRKAKESLFARGGLGCTCFYGLLIAAISLTAFVIPHLPGMTMVQGIPEKLEVLRAGLAKESLLTRGQTYAFTVLGMSQLFHAIGMRDVQTSLFYGKQGRNPLMILAVILGVVLQLAVTEIPFLVQAFGTAHLSLREWGMLTGLASAPLIAHEVIALFLETDRK